MSEPKKFTAAMGSDARKSPVRVAFVTRRTSPQVKAHDDDYVMTFPEALFRGIVAIEVLTLALVVVALLWDAPLEELANPLQTPNPAKAPWYFLGLQELLHYFPPVVAGVLIPALVVLALIAIPYFRINIADEPLWARNRTQRLRTLATVTVLFSIFLIYFGVYAALVPTLLVAGLMWFSAGTRRVPRPLPRLAVGEAPVFLDHVVVPAAGGRADADRNVFPRPGLVLGDALERPNMSVRQRLAAVPAISVRR